MEQPGPLHGGEAEGRLGQALRTGGRTALPRGLCRAQRPSTQTLTHPRTVRAGIRPGDGPQASGLLPPTICDTLGTAVCAFGAGGLPSAKDRGRRGSRTPEILTGPQHTGRYVRSLSTMRLEVWGHKSSVTSPSFLPRAQVHKFFLRTPLLLSVPHPRPPIST